MGFLKWHFFFEAVFLENISLRMGALYLLLAVLDLCCCERASSSCREQGFSVVAMGSRSLLWPLLWNKALGRWVQLWCTGWAVSLYARYLSWYLSRAGIRPVCPALAGGFLTTGPSGKSKLKLIFFLSFLTVPHGVQDPSSLTRGQTCDSYSGGSVQSCLTLWDSMDSSTPGLSVHHQLLELA